MFRRRFHLVLPFEIPTYGYREMCRSRNAIPITDTELTIIAAAAIIGVSSNSKNGYRTPAAIGIPAAL
jgi:hypothetical protein